MVYFGSQRAMLDYKDGLIKDIKEVYANMSDAPKSYLSEFSALIYQLAQLDELLEQDCFCGYIKENGDEDLTDECKMYLGLAINSSLSKSIDSKQN